MLARQAMATLHVQGQDEQSVKKSRRRQSDARWRANLASCYETLKQVIPLTTRASKKQISKVVHLLLLCSVTFLLFRPPGTVVAGRPYVLLLFLFFHRKISEIR